MRQPTPNPRQLGAVVHVEAKDVLGQPLGEQAIQRLLAHVNPLRVLPAVSRAIWTLDKLGPLGEDTQLALARVFLSGPALERATRQVSDFGKTVFFRTQLLALAKYLLKYGNTNSTEDNPTADDIRKSGLALLAITDAITADFRHRERALPQEDKLEHVVFELLSTSYMIRSPWLIFAMLRPWQMYTDIQNNPILRSSPDYIDVEELFLQASGVSLRDYLSVGIALLIYFIGHYLSDEQVGSFDPASLDPGSWLSTSSLPASAVNATLRIIVNTPDQMRARVTPQSRRELLYDFLPFQSSPLLKLPSGRIVLLCFQYLFDRLTTGVYWIVLDHLYTKSGPSASLAWTRFNGRIFQEHVTRRIRELAPRGGPETKLFEDSLYRIGAQEQRAADAMLLDGNRLVLVESSATRLTARRSVSLGDVDSIRADMDKMVFHNAASLDAVIRHAQAGTLAPEGHSLAGAAQYLPVIVLPEGFPRFPVIDSYLRQQVTSKGLLLQRGVAPLAILDIEELEVLSAKARLSLPEALVRLHSNPRFPALSLTDAIASDLSPLPQGELEAISRQILGEAATRVFRHRPS